jgi:hypothetical protein
MTHVSGYRLCFRRRDQINKPAKPVFGCPALLVIVVLGLIPVVAAAAENNPKNHEIKQRLESAEELEEKEPEAEKQGAQGLTWQQRIAERLQLNGGIQLNYEYLDVKDVDDKNSGSSSDFFVSTAELAARLFLTEWSTAKAVVTAEDVGRQGGNGKIRLDEAILTLNPKGEPLYFIGGKTVMPFGVFEDHLIEGTLTEDLYEIDQWGAVAGFAPDFFGLDISFAFYENPQIINNLNDFEKGVYKSRHRTDEKFKSFTANVGLEPVEDTVFLSAYYDSEPGNGSRNESIGGAFTINYWQFTLDTEYIGALKREKGQNGKQNKESAGVVGLAFDLTEALELATRYAFFHDDNAGNRDEVLDYRIVAGFNYSLLDLVDFSFLEIATLSFEYRFSKYEKEDDSDAAGSQHMFQFQLALGF